eukprot:COSAG01_NODE_26661_length_707_cov_0.554276_1_plen_68_part_10
MIGWATRGPPGVKQVPLTEQWALNEQCVVGRPMTFGRANIGLQGVSALMTGWRPGEEGGPAFLSVLGG